MASTTRNPSPASELDEKIPTPLTTLPSPPPSPNPHPSAPQPQSTINPLAATFHPGWRFYLAFLSLCTITLMAALDATTLSVALAKITAALHGTAIEGFWAGTSFLLTSTVFQPVFGSLSDIFGRKPLILLALLFFGVGAIMAAVAHGSMALMLAGRSVQGVGGGGVLVLTEIVVTDLVPLRFRGNYFSMIGAMWAIGSVSGPIVGGALADSWRWIFWLNLPFLAVGAPFVVLFLKLHFKTSSLAQQLRRIDWIGAVLFIGSTTGFLIPLSWGGIMYSWSSWRTLVPLIVSGAGLTAFVVWEERFAADPLIRISVIKNRTAAVTYLGDFLQGMVLWCNLYYMPLYFEAVKGESPIKSGVDMFPTTFTVAPAAIVVGALITKYGSYRWAIWAGWIFTTLGMGIRILLDVHSSVPAWVFINLVGGVGVGMLYPSLSFALQAATPNKDQAYGVSLFTFFRAAGQALGVAVGGTIFQNSMKREILSHVSISANADTWSAEANSLIEVIKSLPTGAVRTDLLQSYADALKVRRVHPEHEVRVTR